MSLSLAWLSFSDAAALAAFGQSRQDHLIAFQLSRMRLEQARGIADELRVDLAPPVPAR